MAVFSFDYPILLHCSQTIFSATPQYASLITLFFYTALKRLVGHDHAVVSLITLFFYTALKRDVR